MSQYPQSSIISLSVPFFIITGGNIASLFTTAPTPSSCCGLCLLLLFLSHDLRVSAISWSFMQSAITITAIIVPGHPLLFRHPCIGSLLIGSLGLSLVLLGGPLSCKVPLVAPGHLRQCSRATIRGKYQVWNQSQILQIWFAGWVKEEISLMCWQNCRLFLSLLPENGLVTNSLTKI